MPASTPTVIEIGTYADGRPAHWHLTTLSDSRIQVMGGLITGRTGSGGTTLLAGIARAAHEHRVAELRAVHTPLELADYVQLAPSYEHLLADLEARIEQRRTDQPAGRMDARTLVLIDEADRVFTRESAPRWAAVVRVGRALGIAVVARMHGSDLRAFGGCDALRCALLTGNRVHLAPFAAGRRRLPIVPTYPSRAGAIEPSGQVFALVGQPVTTRPT
ncbi:hypothetical protein CLV63_113201 [Murinocardiopsis flavida]|uniref:FtsK/SpoIIIE family protein n=1 Tax=Murinocardiopsis flavida TaxID=645275 RepID=A0A2P8DFP7_9ACTN|nr:hypothetical protein [Murinocardiopsis flavida]PSK96038.1 hypothetical protein CLV63_113201 [Murinocardiopsis flavida]